MSLPLMACSAHNNSPAAYARELFKPSKDSWSRVIWTEKEILFVGYQMLTQCMWKQGSHTVLKVLKKYWIVKSVSRPWKSTEFGKNVHEVLRKYGNSEFSHLFIRISFFTTDDSSADVFCIVFHEQNFRKMKLNDGTVLKSFSLVLKEVLKKHGK